AADHIIRLFQIGQDALLHLNAALRKRTGFYRKEAKPKWLRLRHGGGRKNRRGRAPPGGAAGQNGGGAAFLSPGVGAHLRPPFFLWRRPPRTGGLMAGVSIMPCLVAGYHWRGRSRCKGRYCRVFLNASSPAANRASSPDKPGNFPNQAAGWVVTKYAA